jgi:hypothetical protein
MDGISVRFVIASRRSGRSRASRIETIGRQAAGRETIEGLTHPFERG